MSETIPDTPPLEDPSLPLVPVALQAARNGLGQAEQEIRDSIEDAFFTRMQACLKEVWDGLPKVDSTEEQECIPNNEEKDTKEPGANPTTNADQRQRPRAPVSLPKTIDREANKKVTTTITYCGESKADDKVVTVTHAQETLDSRPALKLNLPSASSRIPIDSCIRTADNPVLSFVPGIMEADAVNLDGATGKQIEEYYGTFDVRPRKRNMERGPIDQRVHADEIAKRALKFMQKWYQESSFNNVSKEDLMDTIGHVFSELDRKSLERKVALFLENPDSIDDNVFDSKEIESVEEKQGGEAEPSAATTKMGETVYDTLAGNDPDYLRVIDTPWHLYCPRCKLYCCNLHLEDELGKPSLQLAYESSIDMERRRGKPVLADAAMPLDTSKIPPCHELTALQKSICRRVFLIYQGDFEKIATFINAPQRLVEEFCQGFSVPLDQDRLLIPVKPIIEEKIKYYNLKRYPNKVLARNKETFLRDSFHPCFHDGPCEDEASGCTCYANKVFCCKPCGTGLASVNYFRGCNCKGPCQRICTCYDNNRECDPDLCNCDACRDPPGKPKSEQGCQNDNITMRRRIPTHVGLSERPGAGYGLYSRGFVRKGQFIAEYVGELISHDESERRGRFYDMMLKNTSLFDVTADLTIDASNMCNEMRFINHSKNNPNVDKFTFWVNGDSRIGFRALKDIPAQTEMFFDYGHVAFDFDEDPEPQKRKAESTDSGRGKKKFKKARA